MPIDTDLPTGKAILEEVMACSVDSGSSFHILQLICRVEITDRHDEIIAQIRLHIPFMVGQFAHHVELAEEAIASLERKKKAVQTKKNDAAFDEALGDDGHQVFYK
ncbi:MAG: hypothetical protein AAB780_00315 [Patescibacteria group bacterium]